MCQLKKQVFWLLGEFPLLHHKLEPSGSRSSGHQMHGTANLTREYPHPSLPPELFAVCMMLVLVE